MDGHRKKLREQIILSKNKRHEINVLVDQININDFKEDNKGASERLSEDLEKALSESDGLVKIVFRDMTRPPVVKAMEVKENEKDLPKVTSTQGYGEPVDEFLMSSKFSCPKDGYSYPEIEPRLLLIRLTELVLIVTGLVVYIFLAQNHAQNVGVLVCAKKLLMFLSEERVSRNLLIYL